jgi:uncharacterized transporter YbjL
VKTSTTICAILFVIGVMLGLIQLWFGPWSPQLFIKLEMTVAALLVVVLVLAFVMNESKASKSLRSGEHKD